MAMTAGANIIAEKSFVLRLEAMSFTPAPEAALG